MKFEFQNFFPTRIFSIVEEGQYSNAFIGYRKYPRQFREREDRMGLEACYFSHRLYVNFVVFMLKVVWFTGTKISDDTSMDNYHYGHKMPMQ